MITIYHNPRCSKSRECLTMLEGLDEEVQIVTYLDGSVDKERLQELIKLLGIKPTELVRKGESIWKDNYKGKTLSDDEIIKAMVKNPILIERPIVVKDTVALIGRPPKSIEIIINN